MGNHKEELVESIRRFKEFLRRADATLKNIVKLSELELDPELGAPFESVLGDSYVNSEDPFSQMTEETLHSIPVPSPEGLQDFFENPEPEREVGGEELVFGDEYGSSVASKLMVLERLFSLLSQDIEFHELLDELLKIVLTAVPCEAGSIIEVDYVRGDLFFSATAGTSSEKLQAFRIPQNSGIAGFVAQSQTPYLVGNADGDNRHLAVVSESIGFNVHNLVCIPLVIRGKTFGVVELLNKMGSESFNQEEVSLLNEVANYVSAVIENKLVLMELSKRNSDAVPSDSDHQEVA